MFQQTNTSRKKSFFIYTWWGTHWKGAKHSIGDNPFKGVCRILHVWRKRHVQSGAAFHAFWSVNHNNGFSFMLLWQRLTSQLFAKLYKLSRWRTVFKVEFLEKMSKKRSGWDFRSAPYYCKTKLWSQWKSIVFAIVSFIQ